MQRVVNSYGHSFVTRSDLEISTPPPPLPTEEELTEQKANAEVEVEPAHQEPLDSGENANIELENKTINSEKVETGVDFETAFQESLKQASTITIAGVDRWSKKKQFRHEVKEIFGGKDRNIPGFRTFTKDLKRSKMVKWEFHKK